MREDLQKLVEWASKQAEKYVSPLGNRWLHVQGVVERARKVGLLLNEEDRAYLIAAAYLHDIGYAPSLQKTGFHSIDGAHYLRSQHLERLVSLVAHHSEAQFEANLRGLSQELSHFEREYSPVADTLTYCDMMTNGKGKQVTFSERLTDIYSRYDANSIVSKAIHQAEPFLAEAVQRTEQLLTTHI